MGLVQLHQLNFSMHLCTFAHHHFHGVHIHSLAPVPWFDLQNTPSRFSNHNTFDTLHMHQRREYGTRRALGACSVRRLSRALLAHNLLKGLGMPFNGCDSAHTLRNCIHSHSVIGLSAACLTGATPANDMGDEVTRLRAQLTAQFEDLVFGAPGELGSDIVETAAGHIIARLAWEVLDD